jgi:hypothetical protein
MSLPPPPDPYRPPQPGYGPGQPAAGQWQPPQPTPGAQQAPHGQQPWTPPPSAPPPGPPSKGSGLKWLLIIVAVLLVVAISVGATLLFTRGDGDNSPTATAPPTTSAPGEIASADDTGPVSIITDDPTCDPWRPIADTLNAQENNGWTQRDPAIPSTAWSPELRRQYEAVAEAMRGAADQTVALTRITPHRVMRELYQQSIAYWRAYADSLSTYTASDNHLALTANTTSAAIASICGAIRYDSAATRGPLLPQAPGPSQVAEVGDVANPERFLDAPNSVCGEWAVATEQFTTETAAWRDIDPNLPASQWSAEQRMVNEQVAPVMTAFADKTQDLGKRSDNPVLEDFAVLSAQYRRAFVQSIPNYTAADNYLPEVATRLVFAVNEACKAAGS